MQPTPITNLQKREATETAIQAISTKVTFTLHCSGSAVNLAIHCHYAPDGYEIYDISSGAFCEKQKAHMIKMFKDMDVGIQSTC
jgi:hypothetical protein